MYSICTPMYRNHKKHKFVSTFTISKAREPISVKLHDKSKTCMIHLWIYLYWNITKIFIICVKSFKNTNLNTNIYFKLFIDCKQIFDGSVFKNLSENYVVLYPVIILLCCTFLVVHVLFWYYSCIEHVII